MWPRPMCKLNVHAPSSTRPGTQRYPALFFFLQVPSSERALGSKRLQFLTSMSSRCHTTLYLRWILKRPVDDVGHIEIFSPGAHGLGHGIATKPHIAAPFSASSSSCMQGKPKGRRLLSFFLLGHPIHLPSRNRTSRSVWLPSCRRYRVPVTGKQRACCSTCLWTFCSRRGSSPIAMRGRV